MRVSIPGFTVALWLSAAIPSDAAILSASLSATALSGARQHTEHRQRLDPSDSFTDSNIRRLHVEPKVASSSGAISAYAEIEADAYFSSHRFGSMRVSGRGGSVNGAPHEGGSGQIGSGAELRFKFSAEVDGEAQLTYKASSENQFTSGYANILFFGPGLPAEFLFHFAGEGTLLMPVVEGVTYEIVIGHLGDNYGGAVPTVDGEHLGFYSWVLPSVTPIDGRLMGDWDNNGSVDGTDFLVWQQNIGVTAPVAGDGNNDGVVDDSDLRIWKHYFGHPVPNTASPSAVPEPASLLLATFGTLSLCGLRQRLYRSH